MSRPESRPVRDYLLDLQDRICAGIEAQDGAATFSREVLEGERGGLARPRVLEGGEVVEKAAVNFSHTRGDSLPAAATARRPELAGRAFEAVSVSLIVHPRNPFAPTSHANVRFFIAEKEGQEPVWWFGGGFDLTPYYGYDEDCVHWHAEAKSACDAVDPGLYPRFKAACDEYFVNTHRRIGDRGEPRGIGGVFYDDFSELGFERCFQLHRSVGDHYISAYLPILERRKDTPWGEAERDWQLHRRGRYVEFNLVHDRGTKFGLQSGGRIESILASLPSEVRWSYNYAPQPGTPEAALLERYLVPRDWLAGE
ncbi:oxygen-dependent coproporphyrinogen oxidase [Engelhardtia mirabilis]|uniref:coproporphyrinogen oxidase n=1 Tax=Engelhardtia mirabilis TaxID=2528011 RepID=A0A518BRA4_9BACT|nr:Coproporphyrinogen-III oxidase, aerobic [Planctomycetes bacterium Pla133]QDV03839.1 Coproporphyrinogen-III oxidase, aerobic [Planctomycetes bacterium Pla86]